VSHDHAVDALLDILHRADQGLVVYVYRVDIHGRTQGPYLYKCGPWPGLLETLRDEFGGGEFKFMVRRGRAMVVTARLSVIRLSEMSGRMAHPDLW
jgi:hypothetical protein